MKQLKPCPFCGHSEVRERLYFVHNCMNELPLLRLRVTCGECGATIETEKQPKNASFEEFEFLIEKARAAWNNRK